MSVLPIMLDGVGTLWQRWVVEPVKRLLLTGATPERLAWSLAVGMVVGINPLLGSTTLLMLAIAAIFRLNLVASQVGNHIVYPLELLLFPVFIRLGSMCFGTEHLPIHGKELVEAVHKHPMETTRLLWTWEWHGLVVWAVFAAVTAPLLTLVLRPVLRHMLQRMPQAAAA